MRRILSATEYEDTLHALSPDKQHQTSETIAHAVRELMARYGLDRAVFLCDKPLYEIGSLSAELLEAPIALLSRDARLDLSGSLVCDMLFSPFKDDPLDGKRQAWVKAMADSGCPILSVGIPAGVEPDSGRADDLAVHAKITVAIEGYMPGLFLRDGLDHCGAIWPVGGEIERTGKLFRFEASDAQRLLPPRKRTAHKGDSGKALLCVGSPKYVGAGLLSARACLAAGCGILFVACPERVSTALWRLPEAIGIPVGQDWNEKNCETAIKAIEGMRVVGLGCGIGDGNVSPLIDAALRSKLPVVLDADGLNCLSRHPELYSFLHEKAVLTPHPGEMERLTGLSTGKILDDPVGMATRYAKEWGCTVLLKGAATVVSDGKRTSIVAEGNAGLGKGGSGDVLTGIITGLLSQGVEPFTAACLGSYLLGISAEKAFGLLKERMLRATNVIEALEDGIE